MLCLRNKHVHSVGKFTRPRATRPWGCSITDEILEAMEREKKKVLT